MRELYQMGPCKHHQSQIISKLIFLWTVLALSVSASPKKPMYLPCFSTPLAVYAEMASLNRPVVVVFIPSHGYMDHEGRFGVGEESFAFFNSWQYFFHFMGLSTVTYDKMGTGASGGRLLNTDGASLLCLLSNLKSLPIGKADHVLLVAFGEAAQTLEVVLPLTKKLPKAPHILGVIHLGGSAIFSPSMGGPLPVYSLLGERAVLSGEVEKFKTAQKIFEDAFSELSILDGRDAFLCLAGKNPTEENCRVSRKVQWDVQKWIDDLVAQDSASAPEIKIDSLE